MSDVIWHWARGNIEVFTKQIHLVDKAIKDGELVNTLKDKPRVFVHSDLWFNPVFNTFSYSEKKPIDSFNKEGDVLNLNFEKEWIWKEKLLWQGE